MQSFRIARTLYYMKALLPEVKGLRDAKLYKRIERGDMSALDELIGRYYPEILRYCRAHAPESFGEDAAQETFLKAVRHLEAYVERGHFRAWLYKIASNVCADFHRASEDSGELEEIPRIDPGYERAELSADLAGALSALDEKQREIVELRYIQGLKLRECAEVLGVPLRTAQSRERAALRRLKKLM